MSKRDFEKRFGRDFWELLPMSPGVYRVFDTDGALVYVGKAKNLKRRLAQYKNARRLKAHRKMRAIVKAAAQIKIETCTTDHEALLLELRAIQEHKPKLNIVGVFHFMYPMIGLKIEGDKSTVLLTGKPEAFSGFEWHGSFRLRRPTRKAFFGLMRLLRYLAPGKEMKIEKSLYSCGTSFVDLEGRWFPLLRDFLLGDSPLLLESLILALTEKSGARAKAEKIQEDIVALKKFWRLEVQTLKRLRIKAKFGPYPVPQIERDALRIFARSLDL